MSSTWSSMKPHGEDELEPNCTEMSTSRHHVGSKDPPVDIVMANGTTTMLLAVDKRVLQNTDLRPHTISGPDLIRLVALNTQRQHVTIGNNNIEPLPIASTMVSSPLSQRLFYVNYVAVVSISSRFAAMLRKKLMFSVFGASRHRSQGQTLTVSKPRDVGPELTGCPEWMQSGAYASRTHVAAYAQ